MSELVAGAARAGTEHVAGLRRILVNAAALFLAWLLPRLLTIGSVIVAARVLGAVRFGEYGTAAAFAVILSIVATLGMQPLLIREMARAPAAAPQWLAAAHVVKTVSNAFMLVLLFVLGRSVLHYPAPVVAAALLLGVAYAVGAYAENLSACFQSTERMEVWMQASAVYGLVTGLAGATLVLVTRSIVGFCAAPIAGQLASLAWLIWRAPPGQRAGGPVRAAVVNSLLRRLLPFALGFVALTAHSKLDVLLLQHWWPALEVGIYTAGHKFLDVVQALAVVGAAAVYPRLSRAAAAAGSRDGAAMRLLELALLAGVIAGGAVWLARAGLVALLFGPGYSDAVAVTARLALAIPALAINITGGYVLAAAGAMHRVAWLYAGALILKVGLNAWLVPAHGAVGTATAMLLTEAVLAVGLLVALQQKANALPRVQTWLAAALATLAWAAAGASGRHDATGGFAAAAVFTGLALLLFGLAGGITRQDRAVLVAALRGGGGAGRQA